MTARSRAAQGLTEAASQGRFWLQVCGECQCACYPPRDACPVCLSADLPFRDVSPWGELVTETAIHVSGEAFFRAHVPWRIGLVRMACGPMVLAHLHDGVATGQRVRMALVLDRSGDAAMLALPCDGDGDLTEALRARLESRPNSPDGALGA
jgi:uncharacterized OB-fold protein